MKAFKIISILGVFLITTVFFSNELFSNQKLKRQKRPFQALERLSDELELTEEQRSKIKDQRFATEKETIEMRAKIQIANLELKELLQSENIEDGTIKSKIEEIGELKTNLHWTKVQSRLAIKRVLTAEQLKKLETLKGDRVKKRARRIRNLRFKRLYRNLQNFERDLEPDEMKPESGEAKRKMIEI